MNTAILRYSTVVLKSIQRLCLSVCVSVRRRMPTLLCTDPDATWRNCRSVSSCVVLGGFAIGARVLLL